MKLAPMKLALKVTNLDEVSAWAAQLAIAADALGDAVGTLEHLLANQPEMQIEANEEDA